MTGGIIEGAAGILVAVFGAIFIFGQVRENAKRNETDIKAIKEMIKESQEETKELLRQNMQDVKAMLDEQKEVQNSALSREILHVKDTLNLTINEIRDDIRRLETNQNETIRLREDLSLLKASVRSLHKRLDIEIPDSIRNHDHEEN